MTIGIFTAMRKEAVSFLQCEHTREQTGDFVFYRFALGKHNAVLCCPPYVGEIAASAACQLLITKYGADVVINFGVAGALSDSVALRDFVYVRDVVHYDMDTSLADGAEVGRYACFDGIAVPSNQHLLNAALMSKVYPLARCASADKFVDGAEQKAALHDRFGADICDMESAGVLFACNFNRVPCLLVKCISDSLGGGYGEYERTVEQACADFLQLAILISANL